MAKYSTCTGLKLWKLCQIIIVLSITILYVPIMFIHPYDMHNTYINSKPTRQKQNTTKTIDKTKPSTHVNCATSWRQKNKHQIRYNRQYYKVTYTMRGIPSGTFIHWLFHIESQNRLIDKAKFADKFLMKQYIINYTKEYPFFNQIHHAKLLWDFDKHGKPSLHQLQNLKKKYKAFIVKPNHTSGKQIMVELNDTITSQLQREINTTSELWLDEHKGLGDKRTKNEPWYRLITPHIFIEQNIKVNFPNYPLIEYRIQVFNYKALFLYVYTHDYTHGEVKSVNDVMNLYSLPDFKWMNVSISYPANKSHIDPKPVNLDTMIKFSEHFAMREHFNYVRVDLYQIKNTIFFSEFTFATGGGRPVITPINFDYLLMDILCDNNQTDYEKIYEYR